MHIDPNICKVYIYIRIYIYIYIDPEFLAPWPSAAAAGAGDGEGAVTWLGGFLGLLLRDGDPWSLGLRKPEWSQVLPEFPFIPWAWTCFPFGSD